MAYNPDDAAKLKHVASLASVIRSTIDTLDGKKFGDASIADGKLKFFANVGDTTAIKEIDLPEELFLDQVKTTFVDTYTAANAGISIAGYSIGVQLSQDADNILSIANDGLKGDMKIAGATQGNFATFGASGIIVDSNVKFASDADFAEIINQYFPSTSGGNG